MAKTPAPVIGPSYQYKGVVLDVVDGDTYDVRVDLGFYASSTVRIRLKDFDTPETYKPRNEAELKHGLQAKNAAKRLLPVGTEVVVCSAKMSIYGRFEADVYFMDAKTGKQASVREYLTAKGYAKKEVY